ncbi:MAG: hypothetical protein Q4B54_14030, partial [Coriobacteriales bacterium]|nr:hypothetical protein [Coriobacteriales bacterium]
VSFCSVLATVSVLFLWLRGLFGRRAGLVAAAAFAVGSCAQAQGVQGRGYSLSMLLFLLALVASFHVVRGVRERGHARGRWLALWAVAIALGVYDIPSNIYWVLALYVGAALQLRRSLRGELRYLAASLLGGLLAVALYVPIWLTTAAEAGFGGNVFGALAYGVRAMLSSQYIQGITRDAFLGGFGAWLGEVGNEVVYGAGVWALVGMVGLVVGAVVLSRRAAEEGSSRLTSLAGLLVSSLLGAVVLATLLCSLPFSRVFTYLGVTMAVALALFLHALGEATCSTCPRALPAAAGLAACLLLGSFFSYQATGFFTPTGSERSLEYIFEVILAGRQTDRILLADACASCHCYYNWGVSRDTANTESEPLELAILENNQLVVGQADKKWSNFYLHDELPWDVLDNEMSMIYRDAEYAVYARNH